MLIDASGRQTYRAEIEDTFLLMEENFYALYERCSAPEQKKRLCDTYSAARYACWKAVKEARSDEQGVDSGASQDLKIANLRLAAMLQKLGDIGEFLSLAEEAVRLAASFAPAPGDT